MNREQFQYPVVHLLCTQRKRFENNEFFYNEKIKIRIHNIHKKIYKKIC